MTVLVLAGTLEGRRLARALGAAGESVLASLAGATQHPRPLGVATRIGGFGGALGFAEVLREREIKAVIDSTHPFARRIGPRSAAVCRDLGVPYLRLLRPAWTAQAGDRWHDVSGEAAATRLVPQDACVFLATGAQRLDDLAGLAARRIVVRLVDLPRAPLPWPNATAITGPPGQAEDEAALFQTHGVDWMIARNSGGTALGKLEAARMLGIDVAMIRRPSVPDAPLAATVAEAVSWAERL